MTDPIGQLQFWSTATSTEVEVVKGGTYYGDTWSKLVPKAFTAVLGPGR